MSAADKMFQKLNFMQRCIDYLKSIDPKSPDLESNYEKRSDFVSSLFRVGKLHSLPKC
jgi:hypothetical protein